jgi:hypothetical protein
MAIRTGFKAISTAAVEPLSDDLRLPLSWYPNLVGHPVTWIGTASGTPAYSGLSAISSPCVYVIQNKLTKEGPDVCYTIYSNPMGADVIMSHRLSDESITVTVSGDERWLCSFNVGSTSISGNENRLLRTASDSRSQNYEKPRLQDGVSKASELVSLLELEPIEDGYFNHAEKLIEDSLKLSKFDPNHWVYSTYVENMNANPTLAAAILRLLGRLQHGLVGPWGLSLAINGLSHNDIEVRDAAVRALEHWGGREAFKALKTRADSETVHWLAAYIKQVIMDLAD